MARQLESSIASDEVRAWVPVACQDGPLCGLACGVQGPLTRKKYASLQAQATELAAAIMAEEEELLLLRTQVGP